jgi:hypothetical protein
MKTIKLWACQANRDQTEGRGPMYDVCYASTKEAAIKIVTNPTFYKNYGVQLSPPHDGGKYDIAEREMVVYDNIGEYLEGIKNQAVQTALKKLTKEEKELLGLH